MMVSIVHRENIDWYMQVLHPWNFALYYIDNITLWNCNISFLNLLWGDKLKFKVPYMYVWFSLFLIWLMWLKNHSTCERSKPGSNCLKFYDNCQHNPCLHTINFLYSDQLKWIPLMDGPKGGFLLDGWWMWKYR